MELRLHRGGRFRAWLGARLGGDPELGNRAWRRILHALAAAVLVYYILPNGFFVIVPKEVVLGAGLAALVILEILRHTVGVQLPTLRPYEEGRVASYVFLALAFVGAIVLFPQPIAVAVVLGTAFVDPIAGEVRGRPQLYPGLPLVAYFILALAGLWAIGGWPFLPSAGLAVGAAILAVLAERPKLPWLDDDLLMTFAPALFLYAVGVLLLAL